MNVCTRCAGKIQRPSAMMCNPCTAGRRPIDKKLRIKVLERDGYSCVFCNRKIGLCMDHVLAYAQGGDDSINNLQTLCLNCNGQKWVLKQDEVIVRFPKARQKIVFLHNEEKRSFAWIGRKFLITRERARQIYNAEVEK